MGLTKLTAITIFILTLISLITAYKIEKLAREVYQLKKDYIEFRMTKHGYDYYFNNQEF